MVNLTQVDQYYYIVASNDGEFYYLELYICYHKYQLLQIQYTCNILLSLCWYCFSTTEFAWSLFGCMGVWVCVCVCLCMCVLVNNIVFNEVFYFTIVLLLNTKEVYFGLTKRFIWIQFISNKLLQLEFIH